MDATKHATRQEYLEAVKLAADAADAYYNLTPAPGATDDAIMMDDATYDQLIRDIVATRAEHPEWHTDDVRDVTQVAGGGAGGDVKHSVPMLSLGNVFSDEELDEWAAGLERRLGYAPDGFTIEPKMDGLAISARYVAGALAQLVTRGDGTSGEDVTYAAPNIVGLPVMLAQPVTFEVRGEVLFTDVQYAAANEARMDHGDKPFVNPRNGAAGALRGAKDRTYRLPLTFYAYQVVDPSGEVFSSDERHSVSMAKLADLGISTTGTSAAGMGVVPTIASAHTWIDDLLGRRADLGFAIDGAVIKADSPVDRTNAGMSSRAPHWGIARKFPSDTAISTLRVVHWQLGRTGIITPRAEIEPVMVGGTTVTYATLHNPADITRKGFKLGDKVTVLRAGEVIPRLEAPVVNLRTGAEVDIVTPTVCPRCGSDIDRSQERWRCTRGRVCGLAELVAYATGRDAWDIEGAGDKIVNQLVEKALVVDLADLFTLTRDQLLTLERMGPTSADKLLAQIENARQQPLSRTITALGLRGTGRSLSRRIARHFNTMDAFRSASVADLQAVDGIGSEKAVAIFAEVREIADTIDGLIAAGVNMVEAATGVAGSGDTDGVGALPLAGMTVVVTGSMTGSLAALSRNEMNELIESCGGKSSSSVSARTSLLVAGQKAGSKLAKAQQLGVNVKTPEEFAVLVGRA